MIRLLVLLLTLIAPTAQAERLAKDHAIGLSAIADWSPAQPFIDVMKSARPWIGHKPGQWGGVTEADLAARGLLDADGWPREIPGDLSSIGTVVLTDLPPEARSLAGRYRLRFQGEGIVEVSGRAQAQRYGAGEVTFDFEPGPGPVIVKINRSNPANPVRAITIVHERHAAAFDQGAMFNPDWLARIGQFGTVRFMDWMETNGSAQVDWADRPRPEHPSYMKRGVPVEVMVALANEADFDVWFTLPHQATDAYFRAFAEYVAAELEPGRHAYVEYSNEVWNYSFEQTRWADAQAKALWGEDHAGLQFYAKRATDMAAIWRDVFEGQEDRITLVISTQTGWLGRETAVLDAPLWQQDRPDGAPAALFDAYAITGYFDARLGQEAKQPMLHQWLRDSRAAAEEAARAQNLTGGAFDAYVLAHRYDLAVKWAIKELRDGALSGDGQYSLNDLVDRIFPYHQQVAEAHGLDLIMYEGGTHVVGTGPVIDDAALQAFFIHLNYSEPMGLMYRDLITGWQAAGGGLFNAYAGVFQPGKWGSWGNLRTLEDDNPRWRALIGMAP